MNDIIKTTARFQEAQEPIKQKPTLQIERSLPNTIRASIDSGRDNPFRPDGVIYKSADPIVDYYKFGPNQSRPQSPTDSQLLLQNGKGDGKRKKKRTKRKDESGKEVATRKACWRRWFCCCCCCCDKWCNSSAKNDPHVIEIKTEKNSNVPTQPEQVIINITEPANVDSKAKESKLTKKIVSENTTNQNNEPTTLQYSGSAKSGQNDLVRENSESTKTKTAPKSSKCIVS